MGRALASFFKVMTALVISIASVSCGGPNIFKETASKSSDEAIYEDAVKLTNSGDYTEALAKFAELGASFMDDPVRKRAHAGAYAGQCGQDLLAQSAGMGGSGAPFSTFMSMFTDIDVVPASCYQAQLILEGYFGTTSAARSSSDNMFMAILGISKIGTYLRKNADADQDGTVDTTPSAFDACSSASISDNDVKQVGTGLGLVIDNFTAISAQVGGAGGSLGTLQAQCALIPGNPCQITDPTSASWDATAIKAIRSLIKSQDFGIESCADPTIIGCCP